METYSYTATRVKAMKSKLLSRDDYAKMRKMGLHEMIRSLESGEYGKEISRLGVSFRGAELIDMALNENMTETVNKLNKISNKASARKVIDLYSSKWVYGNLKLVARKIINGLSEEDMNRGVIPVYPTSYDFCSKAAKSEDSAVKAIVKISRLKEDEVRNFIRSRDLSSLENEIDRQYYRMLSEFAPKEEKDDVKKFFLLMIELLNIRNVLKLKYFNINNEQIMKFIVGTPTGIVSRLLKQADYAGAVALLRKENKELAEGATERRAQFENNMEKALLSHASKLLHKRPLSLSPVFGYMISKEAEVRNIRLLVNAKITNLSEDFVEKNLVV